MASEEPEKEEKVTIRVDLQCGACGSLYHREERSPRFCSCCGAAYERYCIACRKKVDMYFEEWWPEDDQCVRTYSPAKRCPDCNARLEVQTKTESRDTNYEH